MNTKYIFVKKVKYLHHFPPLCGAGPAALPSRVGPPFHGVEQLFFKMIKLSLGFRRDTRFILHK